MLKKILMGVSLSALAVTLAYGQAAAPAAGGRAGRGGAGGAAAAGGAGGAGGAAAAGRGAGGAGGAGGGGSRNLPTDAEWAAFPKTNQYVARAKIEAGDDKDLQFDVGIFCKASGGSGNPDRANLGVPEGAPYAAFGAPSPAQHMPAQHMFDNFWWFGDTGVGSWLVTTPAGYILFDASNNEQEAQEVIVDEMVKNGLDPKKIKYAIYGHSHFDHTGGGTLIDRIAHPRDIMGPADWDVYLRPAGAGRGAAPGAAAAPAAAPAPKMKRDIDAEDGMKITLGGLTATIYQMTGHTPGSIGMIVPVKWQGKNHPILIVTAATDVHSREAFIGGYEHIWNIGEANKVEAVYQVHPNTNMNFLARTKYVNDNFAKLQKGGNNPLLYGADKTHRYIEIMRVCTQARMDILGW